MTQLSRNKEAITGSPKKALLIGTKGRLWINRRVKLFIWMTVFFCAALGVFALHFLPEKYPLNEGYVSPHTIYAHQTITFEDEDKTEERRRQAYDSVGDVYILDKNIMIAMENEIEEVFYDLSRILGSRPGDTREIINALKVEYRLSDMASNVLLYMEPDTMNALKSEAMNLLRTNWQDGVRDVEVKERAEKIQNQIELLNYNAPYRELIKAVFNKIELRPNYYYDEDATLKAKSEAAESETPVFVTVRQGQKIIGEGEVVTGEQLEILQALGYQRTSSPVIALSGIVLFLILIAILAYFFLKHFRDDLLQKDNSLILLNLLFFIVLLLAKLISVVKISGQPEYAELVGYLIPVAAGSMLITILLDTKLAVFLTIVLSIFTGILSGNQLVFAINAFVGGLVGIYSVSKFSQRLDWVKAGFFVALADVTCIVAFALINSNSWKVMLAGSALGIMNGFFSAIFAYGSLPFLESAFKVTTSVRLLELSNPNQPLLKRLLLEAPGTYHHSILVGNLGEAAAGAVGADSLLVRVGSYYHDIGKLKRPYFFIENQLGGDNPHQKLTPPLSTLVITSHVKDGLELARQHGIPPVIMDLISEHHGTSVVTYFYHKALEMGNADSINEEDYRYNAPKPQTKEAAIIMLADNVEAAVRSMSSANPDKIEALVRKIIKERLQDGQLDESELTFKDLDTITHTFTRILCSIFHTRIEYPDSVLERMEGGINPHEDSGGQPSETGDSDERD